MVKEFILTRIFDAPLDLVWKCFTQPEYMVWWGPKDFKSGYISMSFKPGGMYHYYMDDEKGSRSYGRQVYKEIDPLKKLVFINSFADKKGEITRHPMHEKWPLELLTTYEFSEDKGKTKFTIHWLPVNASKEETNVFDDNHESMNKGWTGTLDKLEEHLKTMKKQKITPCLWFDSNAEEAVKFYTSVFKDSKTGEITHYGKEGYEFHQKKEGTVLTVEFQLNGQDFLALNGGPVFKFNESISFVVNCKDQEEIDYYWEKLSSGGEEVQCGWLKDKFGVSWQMTPINFNDIISKNPGKGMNALFKMKKIDINELIKAQEV